MAEPFDTLLLVQEHDTTINQLRHRKVTMAERRELTELEGAPRRARRRRRRVASPGRRPGRPPRLDRGADRRVGQAAT